MFEEGSFRIGRFESVQEAFEGSPWMFKFISGICDFYGYPSTSAECSSQQERMMYAWAVASVIDVLRRYSVLWSNGFEMYDLDLLVPDFIEAYKELTGRDVIGPMEEEVFRRGG
tara:strand:+ start:4289 stop:4630 length:342 start_codon:yes stop_codon:yes gene_type:complete